jgi:hypothetical protein
MPVRVYFLLQGALLYSFSHEKSSGGGFALKEWIELLLVVRIALVL